MRVRASGKAFLLGDRPFRFRGVTYGTFRPREADGARYPATARIARDMQMIAEAGFTVVRTYTPPTDDLLREADLHGLRVLAGVFYPDWRYLVGASRREEHRVARQAAAQVRAVARRFANDERVLGLTLGNEIPADVI